MVTATDLFGITPNTIGPASSLIEHLLASSPMHALADRLDRAQRAHALIDEATAADWTPAERRAWIARALAADPETALTLALALPASFRDSAFLWHGLGDGGFGLPIGDHADLIIHPRDLLGQYVVAARGVTHPIAHSTDLDAARRLAEQWVVRTRAGAGRLYLKAHAEQWMHRDATPDQVHWLERLFPEASTTNLSQIKRGVASRLIALSQSWGVSSRHRPLVASESLS